MPNYRRRKNTGLLKVLGFSFGWAVIIGNTIGAGILRTPGEVASHLPNTWLFITAWLIGGIYALLGALSLTELGVMIPESGGQYTFAKHALGDYAGLIVGWSDWISTSGTSALVSLVIAEYVGLLFGISNPIIGKAIALSVLVVFTLLQLRSIGVGSFVQNLTSILKALLFLMLITVCLLFSGDVNNLEISVRPLATESIFTSMILALQSVIYTYDGWTGVIYFSEEVVVPERDIPRSMIGGVVSVIIIYLFVNLALVYLLPVAQIAGKSLAIGYVMQIIFGKGSETFIQILLIISLLSSVNACQLMATRVLFAMSRDGLFWEKAADVNSGGTPYISLLFSSIVGILFILTGTVNEVLAVLAFFFVASYTLSFSSVFILRRREPEMERPYKVWGYPYTTGLALFVSIAFLVGAVIADTKNSIYALVLLAASYPVYRLSTRGRDDE